MRLARHGVGVLALVLLLGTGMINASRTMGLPPIYTSDWWQDFLCRFDICRPSHRYAAESRTPAAAERPSEVRPQIALSQYETVVPKPRPGRPAKPVRVKTDPRFTEWERQLHDRERQVLEREEALNRERRILSQERQQQEDFRKVIETIALYVGLFLALVQLLIYVVLVARWLFTVRKPATG